MSAIKPAAAPLMDSGKALARSGELLIDVTQTMDLYGGGLSSAGAELRNAGDSIAQAAASARFKTGIELVIDELRESGNCIKTASEKVKRAVQEAKQDEQPTLAETLGKEERKCLCACASYTPIYIYGEARSSFPDGTVLLKLCHVSLLLSTMRAVRFGFFFSMYSLKLYIYIYKCRVHDSTLVFLWYVFRRRWCYHFAQGSHDRDG